MMVVKRLFNLFGIFFALILSFIPRNNSIWLFGSTNNLFHDNSKYFFLYTLSRSQNSIRAIWISGDRKLVSWLKSKGYEAFHRWSLPGLYLALRAGIYIYSYYVTDINPYFYSGACQVNLWHGSPLKKIEHDNLQSLIQSGKIHKQISKSYIWTPLISLLRKILDARQKVFIVSSSPYVCSYSLISAFQIPVRNCLTLGYPRNILLGMSRDEVVSSYIHNTYPPSKCLDLNSELLRSRNIILWLPTYRDSGCNFLNSAQFNFDVLDNICEQLSIVFVLKLHYATTAFDFNASADSLKNIIFLDSSEDIMPWLSLSTALITDYSSVMFDYLLSRRPIIRFCFDEDEYLGDRHFYPGPASLLPGDKVTSFQQLLNVLRASCDSGFPQNYSNTTIELYNASLNTTNYCDNVYNFVESLQ